MALLFCDVMNDNKDLHTLIHTALSLTGVTVTDCKLRVVESRILNLIAEKTEV